MLSKNRKKFLGNSESHPQKGMFAKVPPPAPVEGHRLLGSGGTKTSQILAHPARFELTASAFGGQRSIQLSYGCFDERDLTGCLDRAPPPLDLRRELDLPRPTEHLPPVLRPDRSALSTASRAGVASAGPAGTATLRSKNHETYSVLSKLRSYCSLAISSLSCSFRRFNSDNLNSSLAG
jgi:hypothetical protein